MASAFLFAGCCVAHTCASAEPLDDPTRPSSAHSAVQLPPSVQRELHLEGIVRRDGQRIAIVDGRIVHEGEHVYNATIEEITADAVRYSRGGLDHTVRLARTTLRVRQPSTPEVKVP